MGHVQRVLAATDFSPASEPAFEEACRIASESGARLFVLHAYQVPMPAGMRTVPPGIAEDFERAVRADAERRLDVFVAKARALGIATTGVLRQGFADEEILDAVKKEKADLVVMGTHGRRGPSRILLGSIASRVVCRSSCPVMTVRAAAATSTATAEPSGDSRRAP